MNKWARIIVAICTATGILITPSAAHAENTPYKQPYFKAITSDGSPIQASHCGVNFDKAGWLARDFDNGVRGEVGVSSGVNRSLSVTLLFRFSDEEYGKFEIYPEDIRLYISPSNKLFKPTSIERRPFNPNSARCDILQQGEWITLNFPVQSNQAEQIALMFPRGTVSKGETINVRPFRFERIDYSPDGTPSPPRTSITPPMLPPVSPRFGASESPKAIPANIKGTWIIDPKSTEDFVATIPRPPRADKLAQWFGLASGYMALYTYELDGNTASVSAFRGDKALTFERLSDHDTGTIYISKNSDGSIAQTLVASILHNGNIRIAPYDNPEMSYLRWKPGQLKTESSTPDVVMVASRTWLASVQAIIETLNSSPKSVLPSAKTRSDLQVALDQAVKNRIIRKATDQDKKAFFDAYIEKKYTRTNTPVPAGEDALSVINVDISRAYVVLDKFTYPTGMVNDNRVVFFVPMGVPEPSGEIGHSATYNFSTLTVSCSFARTGSFRC